MSSDAIATTDASSTALEVDEVIRTGAIEQARWRLRQLHASFSSTMVILADMHQDEDWRYLTDAEGKPYQSFTAMLASELEISDSWARRQQQGLVDLVLPLRQLTHPDTRIPVSGGDVAALGKRGAEYVREHAKDALAGLVEPRDQEKAIRALIDDTRARIAGAEVAPPTRGHVIEAGPDDISATDASDELPPRTVSDADLVWDSDDEDPDPPEDVAVDDSGPRPQSVEPDLGGQADAPKVSKYGVSADGGGGPSRYGATRTSISDSPPETADDDSDDGEADEGSEESAVAVASLAGVSDGDEAWNASLQVLATAPVPKEPTVDLETVTAAMLRINQLRSQLMAKNRPRR